MNVRITPRYYPGRTYLYYGIGLAYSDGFTLILHPITPPPPPTAPAVRVPLVQVAEIALDEDPGDWW